MVRVNGVVPAPARRERAFLRVLGWVFIGIALVTAGCLSTSSDDSSSSSGSSCDGELVDCYTGSGLVDTIVYIYNQKVAGQYTNPNLPDQACPFGGVVDIVGTATSSSGITSINLNYNLEACGNKDGSTYDLTLTGVLDEDGTFSSATTSMTYISSSLTIVGTAGDDVVNETCAVNVSRDSSSVIGEICGRSFDY